jgi:hypothetical protein
MIIGIYDNTGRYGNLVAGIVQHRLSGSKISLVKWLELDYAIRNTAAKFWLIRKFSHKPHEILAALFNLNLSDLEAGRLDTTTIPIGNTNCTVKQLYTKIERSLAHNIDKTIWIDVLLRTYKEVGAKPENPFSLLFNVEEHKTNWIIPDIMFPEQVDAILKLDNSIIIKPIEGAINTTLTRMDKVLNVWFMNTTELINNLDTLIK